MDNITTKESDDSIDWKTEDELEIESKSFSSCLDRETVTSSEPSTSHSGATITSSPVISHFLEMGFPEHLVIRVLKEYECNSEDAVIEAILTYSVLQDFPRNEEFTLENLGSSEADTNSSDLDYEPSDDSSSDYEEGTDQSWGKSTSFSLLIEMGYEAEAALEAIDRCGNDAPVEELIDFIAADDANDPLEEEAPRRQLHYSIMKRKKTCCSSSNKKRKLRRNEHHRTEGCLYKEQQRHRKDKDDYCDDQAIRLPIPMIGFGVPGKPLVSFCRNLGEDAQGAPYFYYENVALTPKGVWSKISKFLYDIPPEFVDSQYFSAAYRKRGYVHNLPIHNRFQLLPVPPATIQEAFPLTRQWWPSWDTRTKLNCLLTCNASAKVSESIKKALQKSVDREPPPQVKKYILHLCKKFNLVWVGKNKVATLDPDEMEELMGFPRNHTRGGGISLTDRHKFLGNSFQVDTVAYHLSVLKNMYPRGINVLSLFTGIGGAEVALHRLGIHLKNVVTVEISESCRSIVESWWMETGQQGNLIHFPDVQKVSAEHLEHWISMFGGFDLVIGGSPCNNLSGRNRFSRVGLEGEQSSLFYDYYRILVTVRCIMGGR